MKLKGLKQMKLMAETNRADIKNSIFPASHFSKQVASWFLITTFIRLVSNLFQNIIGWRIFCILKYTEQDILTEKECLCII